MPRNFNAFEDGDTGDQDFRQVSKKALYTGTIGALGAWLLFSETGQSNFLNMQVPSAVAAGLGSAAGSVGSDLFSGFVIGKMLDQDASIKSVEATAVKLGVSGLTTVGALKFASGIDPSMNGFLLGAGSKMGGDYLNTNVDPLQMFF